MARPKSWLWGFVASTLLLTLLVLPSQRARAIYLGSATPVARYPFMVHLVISHATACDGSYIGYGWVVTAAHCVVDNSGNKVAPNAVQAVVDTEEPSWSRWLLADRVERHPNYPAHLSPINEPGDVALVHLATTTVYPAIPLLASELPVGSSLTYAGWGCATQATGKCTTVPTQLLKATSYVVPDSQCAMKTAVAAFDFCTSIGGHSTVRHGDSGGPAIAETSSGPILVGVISSFGATAEETTSIPYVAAWIHQVTGIGTVSLPPVPPTVYPHHVYHTCANGACGLNVRSGPGYVNFGITRVLQDGDEVDIVCQTVGDSVTGSDGSATNVWDKLFQGDYVTDFYVDTPGMTGSFSPPIPRC